MTLCGLLSAACDLPAQPTQEQLAQREAQAAAAKAKEKAKEEAEARFHQYVAQKHYLSAANAALNDHLFEGQALLGQVRRLLDSQAGEIEGAAPLQRFQGYGSLARLAKRAGLPDDVVQRYAASAFRAGAGVDNLVVVAEAVRLAREFGVESDAQWRTAARIWALRIEQQGWPDADAQTFVSEFPLAGNLATTAFEAAMELGHWKAARMIAERSQLGDQQFRAARTKEVEELVAAAIQTRNDQRLLELNLEAPGFVDRTVIQTVASRVVAKLIDEGKPMEAYGLALAHGLDASHAKRAADIIFDRALKAGTFAVARQMPDGSFVVVERVPPPPSPAPPPSSPSPRFEYVGDH
ncbi:hypothetical protein HY635_01935 [Candidatus Uhrbacteria bacterium]|nr:hypothetical protein [Candidatus Uhrbacteria bacterium]